MAPRKVEVTAQVQGKGEISEVFTSGVLAWSKLAVGGLGDIVKDRLRLVRKAGCTGFQLFGMLFLMWMAQLRGQRRLHEAAKNCSKALAVVLGVRKWCSQSAMSRTLASVGHEQSRDFSDWLLTEALPVVPLECDESAFHHDTFGHAWRFFDTDGRVQTQRQRGLPEDEDSPEPVRRAANIAKPGYPGRKRGEVQFHKMIVQDAGTARYLGVRLAPGNGEHHDEMLWAAEQCAVESDRLGVLREHAVLRFDGKSSGQPNLHVLVAH